MFVQNSYVLLAHENFVIEINSEIFFNFILLDF